MIAIVTNVQLHRFKIKNSDQCTICNLCDETVHTYFFLAQLLRLVGKMYRHGYAKSLFLFELQELVLVYSNIK